MNDDLKIAKLKARGDIYRKALGRITEIFPPDTEAGRLAFEAITEGDKLAVPNRYSEQDRLWYGGAVRRDNGRYA